MKKIMLALVAVCCAFTFWNAVAQDEAAPQMDVIASFGERNISDDTDLVSMLDLYGIPGYYAGHAVKFTPPRPGWTLKRVDIAGWDGFNGTVASIRSPNVIAIEIRDSDLNLLYRFADNSWSYTNFALNITTPTRVAFDLPPVVVNGDFYVIFYDRGAFAVATEINETEESYIFDNAGKRMDPAEMPSQNGTVPVNWIMWALGE